MNEDVKRLMNNEADKLAMIAGFQPNGDNAAIFASSIRRSMEKVLELYITLHTSNG